MPFKRFSINQGPTSCTSEGNYQRPMKRREGGGGGWKCWVVVDIEVGGFVLMRDERGTKRTWREPSYIMRKASVTKTPSATHSHQDQISSFQIPNLGGWTAEAESPPFSAFTHLGLKSFCLSAGWTSEEEGWWLASILMFNPISVSTPDKPLLPVIHHLRNNGTPPTLINNINLPCPLRRSARRVRSGGGDAIPIYINGCLLSGQ